MATTLTTPSARPRWQPTHATRGALQTAPCGRYGNQLGSIAQTFVELFWYQLKQPKQMSESVPTTLKRQNPARMLKKPDNLSIENYVCTCELGVSLDLVQCGEKLGKFGRKVLQACVVRSQVPKATAMIMGNSKLIICGAKTPEDSVHLAWLVCMTLVRKGLADISATVSNFNVQNIVSTFYVGFELNLGLFHADFRVQSQWQPEKIKPVFFRQHGPNLVHVISDSGYINVTGAKNEQECYRAESAVDWSKYRKGHEYRQFIPSKRRQPKAKAKAKAKAKPVEETPEQVMADALAEMSMDGKSLWESMSL